MRSQLILALFGTAAISLGAAAQTWAPALPLPPQSSSEAIPGPIPQFDKSKSAEENNKAFRTLQSRLRMLEMRAHRFRLETICGVLDDSQHVERYDGTLGPSKAFVAHEEPSTTQLQWLNVQSIMNKPGDDPGNISDMRWCTGTLIAPNLVITAGHCFDPGINDWQTPSRNGQQLPPAELATLMKVNFRYQLDGQTGQVRPGESFPIVKLIEHRLGGLDYAVIEIGPNASGELPNVRYRVGEFDASAATLAAAKLLTIVQHPEGRPKVVEAGPLMTIDGSWILYADLDTLGGSSGSGVLDHSGRLIGVHTNGGCTQGGGANRGVSLKAIGAFSKIIR